MVGGGGRFVITRTETRDAGAFGCVRITVIRRPRSGPRGRAAATIRPRPDPPRPFARPTRPCPPSPRRSSCPDRFRAAVFDMDGLLLDTEPLWHDAERELLERHGDSLHATRTAGVPRPGAGRHRDRLRGPARPARGRHRARDRRDHARPLPRRRRRCTRGPGSWSRRSRGGCALAVASNTSAALVRQALDAVGSRDARRWSRRGWTWGGPSRCRTSTRGVPALGVAPGDAIAFEDSPMGVRAAATAGLFVVGRAGTRRGGPGGGRGAHRGGVAARSSCAPDARWRSRSVVAP